jgi:hypothetical protein
LINIIHEYAEKNMGTTPILSWFGFAGYKRRRAFNKEKNKNGGADRRSEAENRFDGSNRPLSGLFKDTLRL